MMLGRLALWTGALLVSRTHAIVTGTAGLYSIVWVSDTRKCTVEIERYIKRRTKAAL